MQVFRWLIRKREPQEPTAELESIEASAVDYPGKGWGGTAGGMRIGSEEWAVSLLMSGQTWGPNGPLSPVISFEEAYGKAKRGEYRPGVKERVELLDRFAKRRRG